TEVLVEAPQDQAFRIFTERFDQIKPREHNLLAVEIAESVFEARAGGRIFDRGTDGSECQWGRVLAYEPPERIVFNWEISPTWQLQDDPRRTSEVEILFIAKDQDRTGAQMEHHHLDRNGDNWGCLGQALGGNADWPLYLS